MRDAFEALGKTTANTLARRILCDEVGKLLLQREQLGVEQIVFAVADSGARFDVIGVVVPTDFDGELGVA